MYLDVKFGQKEYLYAASGISNFNLFSTIKIKITFVPKEHVVLQGYILPNS
jgi:hypothetical protein